MLTIYFLYGLAFLVLAGVIFTTGKKNDFLGFSKHLWLVGLFGFVHGINEWIEIAVIIGNPFVSQSLSIIGSIFLPVSFVFLVAFGGRVISEEKPSLKPLKFLWVICISGWFLTYYFTRDLLACNIYSRHFICIPGTFLSAGAIYLKLSLVSRKRLPDRVYRSASVAGMAFFLYGFFSGFIVPGSNIFLSHLVNYDKFFGLTGIPVQFFRMLCAVILAICFFEISGILFFEKDRVMRKGGIKRKVAFFICCSILIIVTLGVGLWYFLGYNFLHSMIGRDYMKMSQLLAIHMSDTIRQELDDIGAHSKDPIWRRQIAEANLKYGGMDGAARQAYFAGMEVEWASAGKNSTAVKDLLANQLSVTLKALSDGEPDIGEIFVTDKFGGIIASSGKTSDFYQADEDWWQEAFDAGAGREYVGDIEYDESSGKWGVTLAVAFRDESGGVIGICKAFMEAGGFFKSLDDFKVGSTGHATLIDRRGNIIFLRGIEPMTTKFCYAECLQKLSTAGQGYLVADHLFPYTRSAFAAFSDIPADTFSDKSTVWKVVITQAADEAFAPINSFIFILVLVWTVLVVVMIPVAMAFGEVFARPIHQLHLATEKVMEGDWDYRFDVQTGDEIEQFADTFRDMIANIKFRQDELVRARDELEQLSKNLEIKVRERTKDLTDSQAATMNILDDLSAEKDKVEKYSRELEDALRIKSDFTSMVSHELRTPLTAIKEGIALVADGTTGPLNPDQKEFLDIAKRNVDRLARLINDVLDLQKLESGKLSFNLGLNDINDIIGEVHETMVNMARDKALSIDLDLDKSLPKILIDRDKITQVLTNLVNNSLKFTEKGGLTIATRKEGNVVRISVRDTGPGIRQEDIPKLFQRFEQLEKGTERKTGGTGLGLAISKEIVEMHGGKIWIESVFGQGTAFIFNLPIIERRRSHGKEDTHN